MQINQSSTAPNFKAKFFYSKSLENVAKFAVRTNAFGKLDRMQNNISKRYLKTRLKVDISMTEDCLPQVTFTRFYPKKSTLIANTINDYKKVKSITYTSAKQDNPLWFAMNKIIEMGSKALDNEVFKDVVIRK